MKTLRSILNQKFRYLAFGIIAIIVSTQYFNIRATFNHHENNAIDSSQILADYFVSIVERKETERFNKLTEKLDFNQKYMGITLYDENNKLFASKGEISAILNIEKPLFKNRRLFTQNNIYRNGKVIGTLIVNFSVNQLENDIIVNLSLLVFVLMVILIGFYLYVKQINQIIVTPIYKLIRAIYQIGGTEENVIGEIESKVTEVHELKENFSNLILQLNLSRGQLEILNRNLEKKVVNKTKELTQALDQTKKYQTKIIAQEKLASLGGLSAGIAHEIKNPLNLIINSAQLVTIKIGTLNKHIKSIPEMERFEKKDDVYEEMQEINEICDIITSSGIRADRIIKGMLSQARSQSSKKENQNLTEVCKQGLNLAYHAMRAKKDVIQVEVVDEIQDDVFYVCYAEEIERAIINMLDNSFDSLKDKVDQGIDFKPKVIISLLKNDENIIVAVEDNGSGIAKDTIEKIKEPFFTTKPTGKGTGLGISMINDIVKSQDGELIIESELEKFTIIKMILPLTTSEEI
jgi:signal transduction histidine kinase